MGYWQYMWLFQHAMFDYQGYIPGSQDHSGFERPQTWLTIEHGPIFPPRFGTGPPWFFDSFVIIISTSSQFMFFSTFFIMFHHYIQLKSHWINLKIKSHWITLKIQFFVTTKIPCKTTGFPPSFPNRTWV